MDNEIKKILEQYIDLKHEKTEKEESLNKVNKRLSILESSGYREIDTVSGGYGGTQHYKIEGFPYPEYHRQRTLLRIRQDELNKIKHKIEEQLVQAEQFINSVNDSRIRRMLALRYIEGMSWQQVAKRIGGGNTEDSCRKAIERFFKKI